MKTTRIYNYIKGDENGQTVLQCYWLDENYYLGIKTLCNLLPTKVW